MTVCLCMIVKDEAAVIARCLVAVLPIVDTWLIVDTGSSDGTQDIVRGVMAAAGKPGELVERPWQDFAANRTEALALARGRADYTLVIDADDMLTIAPGFVLPALTADAYDIEIRLGDVRYARPQIFANRLPWRYRGVLHEFAEVEGAGPSVSLPGLAIVCGQEGARRCDPETYRRDAAVLDAALRTETDPFLVSRYTFYLAQSYRDAGEPTLALACYLKRTEQGFWDEERYVSYLNAARLMKVLGEAPGPILAALDAATALCPWRAEALYEAALLCREHGQFEEACRYALAGRDLAEPVGLFVEGWVYRYALLDELGISGFYAGHPHEALAACLTILRNDRAPAEHRDRIVANAEFSAGLLAA